MYVLEFTAALLPRIALPCNEMRDGVVAVRERTLRAILFAVTRETVFDAVPRDTTARDVTPREFVDVVAVPRETVVLGRPDAVARDAVVVLTNDVAGVVVPRETIARDVTPRDGATFCVCAVPRDTTDDAVLRDDAGRADARTVPDVRGDATVGADTVMVGAIGSANTARIDNNVEQTKNAPANRNTVPIAFFM